MNNRNIITISLYIILNSFFILIISQYRFNKPATPEVSRTSTLDGDGPSSKYTESLGSIESNAKQSFWVFQRNFEKVYEISNSIDDIFDEDTLKNEHRELLIRITEVMNNNSKILTLESELPEFPNFTTKYKTGLLADIIVNNITIKDNVKISIAPSKQVTLRIKAHD